MRVQILSLLAVAAVATAEESSAKLRKLNTLLDDSFYTYGDLNRRPVVSYHYRSDRPKSHASHVDNGPASTGLPATSGCLPVRDACSFQGPTRLRGPTYAANNFWNRGDHGFRAPRYHHLDRVALPEVYEAHEECAPRIPVSRFTEYVPEFYGHEKRDGYDYGHIARW